MQVAPSGRRHTGASAAGDHQPNSSVLLQVVAFAVTVAVVVVALKQLMIEIPRRRREREEDWNVVQQADLEQPDHHV
jgi:hypothetical protein